MKKRYVMFLGALLALAGNMAMAEEHEIGEETVKNGMTLGAVYLQAVKMEPEHGIPAEEADIHLEADIHAAKGNRHGFAEGDWVPYLRVTYHIAKKDSDWKQDGVFMAMVASDGPHYGENIKMDGPGKYTITYHIEPPSVNGFMRHIDKETGVDPWWEPFDLSYEFAWIGSTGKKGGY